MYNEAARIATSLQALVGSGLCDDDLELLLVDDGSTDGTPSIVEAVVAELGLRGARIVRLPQNRGKGAAVRTGMVEALGATRVFVDADLSVGVEDIDRCFTVLEGGGADVVYGTRAHPDSALDRSQPGHRVASGRVFNLMLRLLGLTSERDTQCGLKGFTAAAVDVAVAPMVTERFAFDVEVLARAQRAGLHVAGLPVRWAHVDASRVRPLHDGLEMGRAALRIRRQLAKEGRAPATRAGESMAADAIDAMARVERTHWWFRAKHDLVADVLGGGFASGPGLLVDVGAGTGGLAQRVAAVPGWSVVGIELDEGALAHARSLDVKLPLVQAVAEAVPVREGAASAVTCLDVIEHLDDDVAGLAELGRVAGSGIVVVAVPAYQWAWSDHDVRLGHRRRYTRRRLVAAAEAAGLDVLRATHFHSWLAPIALLVRRTPIGRLLGSGSAEEASMGAPWVNRVLRGATVVERALLRHVDLPFGLSILLVARVSADAAADRARDLGRPTT